MPYKYAAFNFKYFYLFISTMCFETYLCLSSFECMMYLGLNLNALS